MTTDNRLKAFADRLDRLEDERLAIVADTREIYEELKGEGYNPKALRRVLKERRKKPDAALEADVELYRAALGEPGATYRAVAEKLGVSKSKLQRLVPRKNGGTAKDGTAEEVSKPDVISPPEVETLPAHDAATGEIDETMTSVGGVEPLGDRRHAEGGNKPGSVPGEEVSLSPSALVGATVVERPITSRAGVATGPTDTQPEDTLEIPAHLKRTRAAV